VAASAQAYAEIERLNRYSAPYSGPRWMKMAMQVLDLPGGAGGLRRPYLMPSADEVRRFGEGLLALDIDEVNLRRTLTV
jgi:hypothetical protein